MDSCSFALLVSTAVDFEHIEAVLVLPKAYLFGRGASGAATLQLSMNVPVAERLIRGDRVSEVKVEVFDGDNMSKYQKAADGDVKMCGDGRKSFVLHPSLLPELHHRL